MDNVLRSLEKMGSNFLVGAIVPSLSFVLLVIMLFQPAVSPTVEFNINHLLDAASERFWFAVVFSVLLGFTLSSLNTFFIKTFEGYILLHRLPSLRRAQIKRFRYLRRKHQRIEKSINRFDEAANLTSDEKQKWLSLLYKEDRTPEEQQEYERLSKMVERKQQKLEMLLDQEYRLASHLDSYFPHHEGYILPTRFGNILRAAETYPSTRYGIDAVPVWPRLIYVIPLKYYEMIEHSWNQLSFLVNCAVLSGLFTLLSLIILGWTRLIKPDLTQNYLIAFGVSLTATFIFYRAAQLLVMTYGNMIRSAYDLFRSQLLVQLNQKLPDDLDEERDTWTTISDFFNRVSPVRPVNFIYDYRELTKKQPEPREIKFTLQRAPGRAARRSKAARISHHRGD